MVLVVCPERALRWLQEAALRLRRPAKRLAGSPRNAVVFWAVLIACYSLLLGCVYADTPWTWFRATSLLKTSCHLAFFTPIMDMSMIYGFLTKNNKVLKKVLCATLAYYMTWSVMSFSTFISMNFTERSFTVLMWQIPHLGLCIVYILLMYGLLAELRGDVPPEYPPSEDCTKNMVLQDHTSQADDAALLKEDVEQLDTPGGPAALAPSSDGPAPQPVRWGTAAAFGPPSCSEA